MKGKYHIIVSNNRVHYEFDIRRNITVIRGDSATGKTTLVGLIDQHYRLGESAGISFSCAKECVVLTGVSWQVVLESFHDHIVFIDENSPFVKSREFAKAVKESDNYFVIVTREDLYELPYSVDEIYGIHVSGKYHDLKHTYNEFYRIYPAPEDEDFVPEAVVTEDSNSGFDFFNAICQESNTKCLSAGGKSNIPELLSHMPGRKTLVIADGAAIGAEMTELYSIAEKDHNVRLYLPESFEWLILMSGLIDGNKVQDILSHPEDFIESQEYFSWERYFTWLLIDQTRNTYLSYSKTGLNPVYLNDNEKEKILTVMRHVL